MMTQSLFNQLSDELFDVAFKKILEKLSSNRYYNAQIELNSILSSASLAQPVKTLDGVLKFVSPKVLSGEKLKDSKDLPWYLRLLKAATHRAGKALIPHTKAFNLIIRAALEHDEKDVNKAGGKLLKSVLHSLIQVYITDYRSNPLEEWNSEDFKSSPWKYWGRTYSPKNVKVAWHVPSDEELAFASSLVQTISDNALAKLSAGSIETLSKEATFRQLHNLKSILSAGIIIPDSAEEILDDPSWAVERGLVILKHDHIDLSKPSAALKDLRQRIIETLHNLIAYLVKNRSSENSSFMKIISVYDVLLNRRAGNRNATNFGFWKMIKSKWQIPNSKEKSRALWLDRIDLHYGNFLLEMNRNYPYTKSAQTALDDLLSLSQYSYSAIRKNSQKVLQTAIEKFPLAADKMIPKLINKIVSDCPDEEFNGAVHTLLSHSFMRKITKKWKHLSHFIIAICSSFTREKIKDQMRIYHAFVVFAILYRQLSVKPASAKPLSGSFASASSVPVAQIEKAAKHFESQAKRNQLAKQNILEKLLSIIKDKPSLHWRYQVLISASLLFLLRADEIPDVRIVNWFTKSLANEVSAVRKLSVKAMNCILSICKPVRPRTVITTSGERITIPKMEEIVSKQPSSDSEWDTTVFYDKTYTGWYQQRKKTTIYAPERGTLAKEAEGIWEILSEPKFINTLLTFQANDHNFVSEDEKGKSGGFFKQLGQRFGGMMGQFAGNFGMNSLFGAMADSSMKQAADELIGELARPTKDWPYTFSPLHSPGISILHAQLWKGLAQCFGLKVLGVVRERLVKMMSEASMREQQCAAVEILAGIVRGSKHWTLSDVQSLWKEVNPALQKALASTHAETIEDWSSCLRFISFNRDPRRLFWLNEWLLAEPLAGDTASAQTKTLHFVRSQFSELTWRGAFHAKKVLPKLPLSHEFKIVRWSIGELINLVLHTYWDPKGGSTTDLDEFAKSVIAKLQSSSAALKDSKETTAVEENLAKIRETVLHWLSFGFKYGYALDLGRNLPALIGSLLMMANENDSDVNMHAKSTSALAAQTIFTKEQLAEMIELLVKASEVPAWRVRLAILPVTQIIGFNHRFLFSEAQMERIYEVALARLSDPHIEVRELARDALASLLRGTSALKIGSLSSTFTGMVGKVSPRRKKSKTATSDTTTSGIALKKHGGILGLSALLLLSPYEVPDWMPNVLETVALHINDSGIINATVKKTINEFWRTHSDQWQLFKEKFSAGQLDLLNNLLTSPSYYA